MVLRVLFYILSFYMDYTANYKRIKKLPAIFPIVLYNGKRKWSAPTKISDLIETEPSLGAYAIDFQYLLLNEKAYSKGNYSGRQAGRKGEPPKALTKASRMEMPCLRTVAM